MPRKSLKKILLEEIEAEERFQKEFLTEKERKSFEQVEKYVSKNRKDVEDNLRKRKSERVVEDDFRKFTSKSEKDRYEEAKLESMISQVAFSSKGSGDSGRIKQSKVLYIIYLVVLLISIVLCFKFFLAKYL